VAFLPRLYAEGFEPVRQWRGADLSEPGLLGPVWPEYDPVVLQFVEVASRECWCDYDYDPVEAGAMLEDGELMASADLDQVKTVLAYCVRGERFADGHWDSMIRGGYVRGLLDRLKLLTSRTT